MAFSTRSSRSRRRNLPYLLLLVALLAAPRITWAADPASDDIVDADDGVDDYEDPEESNRAHLLVRKSRGTSITAPVVGSNLTLTVELYNAGKSSAKGVKVEDSVPAGFKLLEGSTSFAADAIAPGATKSFTYVLSATTAGIVYLSPVKVAYVSADDNSKLATQTTAKPLRVLTAMENVIATALRVGSYATLGALQTPQQWQQVAFVVGGVATAVLLGFGYKGLRDTNKRWRYQRALKEVEKMQ